MLGGALAVQTIDRSENARIDRHGLSPRTRSEGLAFGDGQVGDGDRLLGLGHEGSAGELQLPGHHPRRRLGVGSPLRCAEPMVEERRAQRAVDTLQAVVLAPPRGLPRTAPGRTQQRKTAPASGPSARSSAPRRYPRPASRSCSAGSPVRSSRLLSVDPAGALAPQPGSAPRSQSVINRRYPVAPRLQAGASARQPAGAGRRTARTTPALGRHRAPLAAPALGSYSPLAWTRATCGSAGSTTPSRR